MSASGVGQSLTRIFIGEAIRRCRRTVGGGDCPIGIIGTDVGDGSAGFVNWRTDPSASVMKYSVVAPAACAMRNVECVEVCMVEALFVWEILPKVTA